MFAYLFLLLVFIFAWVSSRISEPQSRALGCLDHNYCVHQHFWMDTGHSELVRCWSLDSLTSVFRHLTEVPQLKAWLPKAHPVVSGERWASQGLRAFPVGATPKEFQVDGLQTVI